MVFARNIKGNWHVYHGQRIEGRVLGSTYLGRADSREHYARALKLADREEEQKESPKNLEHRGRELRHGMGEGRGADKAEWKPNDKVTPREETLHYTVAPK